MYKGDSQESISGAPWSPHFTMLELVMGSRVLQPVRACPSSIPTAVSWVKDSLAEEGLITFTLALLGSHFQGTVHH